MHQLLLLTRFTLWELGCSSSPFLMLAYGKVFLGPVHRVTWDEVKLVVCMNYYYNFGLLLQWNCVVWYSFDVDSDFCLLQLTPVNSSVGLIEATDVDSEPLYYRLESATVRTCLMSWNCDRDWIGFRSEGNSKMLRFTTWTESTLI